MTCQRTKFVIGRDLVALPTAPALAALAALAALEMPLTPGSAEDTVNRLDSRSYRVILNRVGPGPLLLLCRGAGHRRVSEPMSLSGAHDSHGVWAIARKVDGK